MFGGLLRRFLGGSAGAGKQQACRADLEEAGDGDAGDLDALSNRANDLTAACRWEEAQRVCERLRKDFPEELDADDRLAQLYEARGEPQKALPYAQAALRKAQRDPEKFDRELVAELKEQVAEIQRKCPSR